jgi:hypothetical protein
MQRTDRTVVVRLVLAVGCLRTRITEAACNILVCGAGSWSAIALCIRRALSVRIFCAGVAGRATAIIEALFPITQNAAITSTTPCISVWVQTRILIPTSTVIGPLAFPIRRSAVAPTGNTVASTTRIACHPGPSAAFTRGPLAADTFGSQRDDQHCSSRSHPLHGVSQHGVWLHGCADPARSAMGKQESRRKGGGGKVSKSSAPFPALCLVLVAATDDQIGAGQQVGCQCSQRACLNNGSQMIHRYKNADWGKEQDRVTVEKWHTMPICTVNTSKSTEKEQSWDEDAEDGACVRPVRLLCVCFGF